MSSFLLIYTIFKLLMKFMYLLFTSNNLLNLCKKKNIQTHSIF